MMCPARYAHVEATDGDSFNPRVLPDDRRAIADVQHALLDWKRYILTAKRREAELVFVVRKGDLASVQGGIRPTVALRLLRKIAIPVQPGTQK
jgi:hypothetical protein